MSGILDQLTHQSPQSLEEIIKRARILLSLGGTKELQDFDDGSDIGWLLEGLKLVVADRGLPPMSLARIQTFREFKKDFTPIAPEIAAWLMTLIPADSDRTKRVQLSYFAGRCLARHISGWTPVHWTTLLLYYSRVPDAIEHAFPTYIKNGWIDFVLDFGRRK